MSSLSLWITVALLVVAFGTLAIAVKLRYFTSDAETSPIAGIQLQEIDDTKGLQQELAKPPVPFESTDSLEKETWETHKNDVLYWCEHVNQGMSSECFELLERVFLHEKPYREGVVPVNDQPTWAQVLHLLAHLVNGNSGRLDGLTHVSDC